MLECAFKSNDRTGPSLLLNIGMTGHIHRGLLICFYYMYVSCLLYLSAPITLLTRTSEKKKVIYATKENQGASMRNKVSSINKERFCPEADKKSQIKRRGKLMPLLKLAPMTAASNR